MNNPNTKNGDAQFEFSRIALGLWRLAEWNLTPQQRLSFLQQAIDLGIITTDHADIYGGYVCESLFGEALALAPGVREKIHIVSKCGIKMMSPQRPQIGMPHYDTRAAHIIASAENSLRNFKTDYLDVLLIHRPDPLMNADEMAEAFMHLRDSGKVKHFGVSNFTTAQFDLLASRFPIVTNQIEMSLLHIAPIYDGSLDQAQRLRCSPMIWSALAGGRLFSEESPRSLEIRALLNQYAEIHSVSPSAIATAWILKHPSKPVVLTGSGRVQAIQDAHAATTIELSHEQWFSLLRAAAGKDVD